MTKRQMHLVAYSKTGPTARHVGGWRHPEAVLDDFLKPGRYAQYARTLEEARFDGCFFADLIGIYDIYGGSYDMNIAQCLRAEPPGSPNVQVYPVVINVSAATVQAALADPLAFR